MMGASSKSPILLQQLALLLATIAAVVAAASTTTTTECVYSLYIKTGTRISAGTNSVIGVTLWGSSGDSVTIDDIETWGGLMGTGHDYFERGSIDIFSGLAECTSSGSICALNLTSDGTGTHPGWYVKYVQATITGAGLGCNSQTFEIEQWVADDAYPYQLYAFRNACDSSSLSAHRRLAL